MTVGSADAKQDGGRPPLALWSGLQTVILCVHMDVGGQPRIENSRQDALFYLAEILVGGNHGWELLVVPVIEDLIELLACPRRRVLGPEVVEYQKLCPSNRVEPLVIGDTVARVERGPKVIE